MNVGLCSILFTVKSFFLQSFAKVHCHMVSYRSSGKRGDTCGTSVKNPRTGEGDGNLEGEQTKWQLL